MLRPFVQEVDLAAIVAGHLAEEEGLLPFDVVLGLVGGHAADPGAEIFRILQLVQALECGHIAVLHDVQGGILVLEQESCGLVDIIICKGVQLFDRVLVALGGPRHCILSDLVHRGPSLFGKSGWKKRQRDRGHAVCYAVVSPCRKGGRRCGPENISCHRSRPESPGPRSCSRRRRSVP